MLLEQQRMEDCSCVSEDQWHHNSLPERRLTRRGRRWKRGWGWW